VEGVINRELLRSSLIAPQEKPFQVHDTRLKGFILRIQPSGQMTYYYEYTLNGKRNRVKIGTTKEVNPTLARDRAEDFSADVIKGINPSAARREARLNSLTLEDYLTEEYEPWIKGERRFRSWKETLRQIRSSFRDLLKKPLTDPAFSNYVEKHRTARLNTGIKKSTIDREVGSLKAVFAHAVRNKEIQLTIHPLATVKALRREEQDDEGDERVRYLGQHDPEEPKRFWAAIEAREVSLRAARRRYNEWRRIRHLSPYPDLDSLSFADHLKPMIVLSLNTGLRRKELFLSTWENFKPSLAEPLLTVPGSIAKNKKFSSKQSVLLANYFGFNEIKTKFLYLLVQLESADHELLRAMLKNELEEVKLKSRDLKHVLKTDGILSQEDKAIFYSNWYYIGIRVLTFLPDCQTRDALADRLRLARGVVDNAVDFLLSRGLCVEKNGKLKPGPNSTHLEGTSPMIDRHLGNWRLKAIERHPNQTSEEKSYSVVKAISKKEAAKVRQMILDFSETLHKLGGHDCEEVFYLNIDWHKLS